LGRLGGRRLDLAEPRTPNPGRGPAPVVLALPSSLCPLSLVRGPLACPPPAQGFGFLPFNPHSAIRNAFRRPSALVTPYSALRYGHRCPQWPARLASLAGFRFPGLPASGGSPVPVPRSLFPVPAFLPSHRCPQVSRSLFPVPRSRLLGVIHNGVWPCVHVKNRQIRVKIDQKGDVFRQKGIKKARISSCPS
jgi:hypothetical protein